jgi:hypothetical protein
MAKLANLDHKGGYTLPVVLLKDNLVINRAVYDVNNLYPVPFKNMTLSTDTSQGAYTMTGVVDVTLATRQTDEWLQSSCWFLRGRRSGNHVYGANFLVDNVDSDIGYYLVPYGYGGAMYLHKVSLTSKEIINTSVYGIDCLFAYFLSQNDDYIFGVQLDVESSTSYPTNRFFTIRKDSFSVSHTAYEVNYRFSSAYYLTENADRVWAIWDHAYNTSQHRYIYVDKGTGSWSGSATLQSNPVAGIDCHSVPSQTRALDADTDAAYTVWPSANSTNVFEVFKYQVDKSLQTVSSTQCALDFTAAGVTRSDVLTAPTVGGIGSIIIDSWMVTGGSSDYLCFSVSEHPNSGSEIAAVFKIYIFKIETTDTNLTYIGQIDPALRIRQIMPLEEDWTKLMVVYNGGVKIYDWNASTETYDYVDSYAASVQSIMIDNAERIWILTDTKELHMFSATTPVRITVNMESETYNYTGLTINTYANVSAWDIDASRIAANVKLVLEGAAEFTDGSKSKTITTSASADTQVNINLTGSSYSRVLASVVV